MKSTLQYNRNDPARARVWKASSPHQWSPRFGYIAFVSHYLWVSYDHCWWTFRVRGVSNGVGWYLQPFSLLSCRYSIHDAFLFGLETTSRGELCWFDLSTNIAQGNCQESDWRCRLSVYSSLWRFPQSNPEGTIGFDIFLYSCSSA